MDTQSESDYSDAEEVHLPQKRKSDDKPSKQTSKKFKKELYRQPTTEELNQIRETENLFNSNLFRLQLKELLTEIQVKAKYKNQFQLWYDKFTKFLKKLPEREEASLLEVQKKRSLRKADFKCDQDVNLCFLRPTSWKIVGLHALNATVGSSLTVDVTIEMPKKCLYEKDYLNNRYLVKRYYYLLYLAEEMEKANISTKISLTHLIDFNAMPALKIQPGTTDHVIVKLSVVPPEDFFKDNRFLPNKNNLKVVLNEKNPAVGNLVECGTAHHNSMLLQNFRANKNHAFASNLLQDVQSAREGLQFLIVWLKQRQLYGVLGLNDEFLVQLLAYLLNERYINKHTSSYQIVRSVWLFISKSDWQNEPISVCKDIKDTFTLFKEYFDVVFLDSSGCYNITSFLSLDLYSKLKYEAKLAIQYLDENVTNNSFDCLFIKNLPLILQYDAVLRLKDVNTIARKNKLSDRKDKLLLLQNFPNFATVKAILSKLKSGLNKRAFCLVPHFVQNEICYELNDDGKLPSNDLLIGVTLDLDNAFNVLELGPTPHDPKVKEFLNLWGKLSSLRRFPDGTTCETVYFETKTMKAKREIIKKIIDLIVREKLKLNYELVCDQFEEVLINKKFIAPFPNGTNEEICLKIISLGDELNSTLRTLKLPLEITSILGNSDVFNYTEPFPPIPASHDQKKTPAASTQNSMTLQEDTVLPCHFPPVQQVIQLSLNSKWPNDLQATRHIKTAFLLKLSELLQPFNVKTNLTREYLDVFYKGIVFRYSIFHPKEVSLVKRTVNEQGVVGYKENKESATLEREFDIGPKICSALKGIQSQFPSFGPSTALAKRWLRSHMIDEFYISDTVINLLNASLFLNSAPFSTPVLPQIGFLRFLKFLFETDWSVQMAIVNFNDELSRETIAEIEMNFCQHRENYPNLCILMPYDQCKSVYTKTSPTKEVLKRISVLAKHCYETFSNCLSGDSLPDIKSFFRPCLEGFDVLIRLKLTQNTRFYQNISYKHSKEVVLDNFDEENSKAIPVTDFNPVDLYLNELRQNYGKFALFFHDSYGGNIIGVLWKPHVLETVDFKVSQISGKKVHNNKLIANFDAIINDFHILGKGIVKKKFHEN